MNPALWFLLTRSLANAVVFRLKRLRQPKYALGALFGVGYFYFYFYRFLFRGDLAAHRPALPAVNLGITPDLTLNLAALGLLVATLAFAWILPASRAALSFTEAELTYLLPAPITRAALIRFKLLKSQLGLLLIAIFMTLFTGRFARDGHAWLHTGGWWVVFATLQLHRLGASFVLTRLMDRGLSNTRRRLFVLAGVAGCLGLLIAWRQSAPQRPDLSTLFADGHAGAYLRELVAHGPGPWLLAPFRWVVAPWFAPDPRHFLFALGPALAIIALHYAWVIRSDVSFEEASIALAQKRAAFLAARRSGQWRSLAPRRKSTALFTLRPIGWAPVAFVWKSWIQAGGRAAVQRAVWVALLLVAGTLAMHRVPAARNFLFLPAMLGLIVCAGAVFAAPQAAAQMMRRELSAADWLKTVPVRGWHIVLGQLFGPACGAAALQMGGLALIWASGVAFGEQPQTLSPLPGTPPPLGPLHGTPAQTFLDVLLHYGPVLILCAGLVLPVFNLLMSLVPTAAMMLFPGWFKPGEQRGIEATGLAMMMFFGQFAFIALALVGPALVFGGVGYVVALKAAPWIAALAGAFGATVILALEGGLGVLALGDVFERYDASRE